MVEPTSPTAGVGTRRDYALKTSLCCLTLRIASAELLHRSFMLWCAPPTRGRHARRARPAVGRRARRPRHTAEQRRADPVLVPQSNETKARRGGDDAAAVLGMAFGPNTGS